MAGSQHAENGSEGYDGGISTVHRDRALAAGLDPEHCNLLQICCVENGLDPHGSTCLDLAAVKLGRQPGELSEEEIVDLYGANWVLRIVD